uniref:Uncharacterized protein n=1 Tax=Anguilla anguilla TaxID=7936 RepID=A0A0E9QCA1_ANGAN
MNTQKFLVWQYPYSSENCCTMNV